MKHVGPVDGVEEEAIRVKSALPLPREHHTERVDAPAQRLGARLAVGPPEGIALVLLVLVVAADRSGVRVSDNLNLRFELIAGGLVAVWGLWRLRGAAARGIGWVEGGLLGWLAVAGVASALFAPLPSESLKFTLLLAGLLTIYAAGFLLIRSAQAVVWAALAWVGVGTGVTLLGLAAALLYTTVGWTPGISFNRLYQDGIFSAVPMVYSTLWEANIFGSYALTVGVLAFALSRAPAFQAARLQWALRGAMACAFCGMILSMTRTVWVVGLALVALLAVVSLKGGLLRGRAVPGALLAPVLVGVAVGLLVGNAMPAVSWRTTTPWALSYPELERAISQIVRGGPPPVAPSTPLPAATPVVPAPATPPGPPPPVAGTTPAFLDRLRELLALDKVPTWLLRQEVRINAVHGWQQRPWLGWGLNSYRYVYPPAPQAGFWIPNLELHILFDTGLVGLLLVAGAGGWAVRRGGRALRGPVTGWSTAQYALFGLLFAGLGLFLAYQLTEGTGLGFTWLFFAMLVAAGRYAAPPAGTPHLRQPAVAGAPQGPPSTV
jgi:hypothetical protein